MGTTSNHTLGSLVVIQCILTLAELLRNLLMLRDIMLEQGCRKIVLAYTNCTNVIVSVTTKIKVVGTNDRIWPNKESNKSVDKFFLERQVRYLWSPY